jgi:hypothetical protein
VIYSNQFIPHLMMMFIVVPKPYPGFPGCFVTAPNNNTKISYILLAVMEAGEYLWCTSIFHVGAYVCKVLMVLMAISAYKSCLSWCCETIRYPKFSFVDKIGSMGELSRVIHRDGEYFPCFEQFGHS